MIYGELDNWFLWHLVILGLYFQKLANIIKFSKIIPTFLLWLKIPEIWTLICADLKHFFVMDVVVVGEGCQARNKIPSLGFRSHSRRSPKMTDDYSTRTMKSPWVRELNFWVVGTQRSRAKLDVRELHKGREGEDEEVYICVCVYCVYVPMCVFQRQTQTYFFYSNLHCSKVYSSCACIFFTFCIEVSL